jgi:hypothetical protein
MRDFIVSSYAAEELSHAGMKNTNEAAAEPLGIRCL